MTTPHGTGSRIDETPEDSALRARIANLMPRAIEDLTELVTFRSVADPSVENPQQCRLAAEWVRDAFSAEGLRAEIMPTPDGSEAVIAHYDGPPGAPRVLLYAHYDVQPANPAEWTSDPWTLTERDGRYYARGAADCKGSVITHLTALRALRADANTGEQQDDESQNADGPSPELAGGQDADGLYPVSLTVVVEGSEEQGTGGLEQLVAARPELFAADVILIQDTGNAAVGVPTLTVALRGVVDAAVRVRALDTSLHSGAFGGAAPDPIAALMTILASLRNAEGDTVIDGLPADGRWPGEPYPTEQFAADAGVLPGVEVLGSGSVADQIWARPAATVLGIEAPAVEGAVAAIQPRASALVNLRIPPSIQVEQAEAALVQHLKARAPWGVQVEVEITGRGRPFAARTDTEAFEDLSNALGQSFGRPTVTIGQGGAIPLTAALAEAHREASIVMLGLAEPASRIHAPDESVHPGEIEHIALGTALFMRRLGAKARN
ncbi:MAG TPA: dipeptidase [Beutenbergiaceae bacterium]|nr:dipeptidase [Beutenbergiaceae bacterium]